MAENIFNSLSGLGGLMKGFSSFMPQDDPDTKVYQAMSELNELQGREKELYANIGKQVYQSICNQAEYSEIVNELIQNENKQVRMQEQLKMAEQEKQEQEKMQEKQLKACTCPQCLNVNPEGVKFCQECGTKLGETSQFICPKCGLENPPQTRFCGECGTKLS